MDKIEKIRQEIERLKKLLEESTYYLDNSQQALGYSFALDDFNEFLDTLSEEPDKSLEEEIKDYFQGYWPGTDTAEQCNTDLHFTPPAIMRLARHFAKWGVEHTPLPEDTVLFNKGIEEGKRLMMEDAVSGTLAYEPHLRRIIVNLDDIPDGAWNGGGTPVEVIIFKKEQVTKED